MLVKIPPALIIGSVLCVSMPAWAQSQKPAIQSKNTKYISPQSLASQRASAIRTTKELRYRYPYPGSARKLAPRSDPLATWRVKKEAQRYKMAMSNPNSLESRNWRYEVSRVHAMQSKLWPGVKTNIPGNPMAPRRSPAGMSSAPSGASNQASK